MIKSSNQKTVNFQIIYFLALTWYRLIVEGNLNSVRSGAVWREGGQEPLTPERPDRRGHSTPIHQDLQVT